jgi:twitching motility protein PilT
MSLEKFASLIQAFDAVKPGFSDIHLCTGRKALVRVDNDLVPMDGEFTHDDFLAFMRQFNKKEDLLDTDFAVEAAGFRWRTNICRNLAGLALVARRIPPEVPFIGSLGVPEYLSTVAKKNSGLFIVTGITGSGKTTTLAAMLELINRTTPSKIVTLEDPIEFVYKPAMSDIIQRELYTHTSSFLDGIKAMLREDPDVALVGEIRDRVTAEAAFELAETGHLVFATLHADKAREAIDRLASLFSGNENGGMRLSSLASTLIGTLTQKLVPKVGGGRVIASELMINTPGVAALIREGDSAKLQNIIETSSSLGMYSLNQNLEQLYSRGLISRETAHKFSYDVDGLRV